MIDTYRRSVRDQMPPRWWWQCLLPLVGWTALILIVATRPSTSLISAELTTSLHIRREFLQYPYHLGAFVVLAALSQRCLGQLRLPDRRVILITAASVAAISIASELLQFLVPTRTPTVRDVMLDVAGAAIGVVVMRVSGRPPADPYRTSQGHRP